MASRRCIRALPPRGLAGLARLAAGAGLLVAGLLAALPATADGPSRPLSAAETAFFRRVLPALAQAAPPGPAGWELSEQSDPAPPRRLGAGAEVEPLQAFYRVAWADAARLRQAQEAQAAAGTAAMQRQAGEQSAADQEQRLEVLGEKLGAAAERGDQAEMLRLQKQMEEVSQAMARVFERQDRELKAAMDPHQARDAEAGVTILVNVFGEDFIGRVSPEKPVAGLAAYRQEGEDDPRYGWREGTTWVFLGPGWKLIKTEDSAHMENEPRPELAHTEAQTIVVRVQADPRRARKLLEAMDWNALKALLK
ncbi:MAG: hypothetical protein V1797_19110 [Pseudomonadota bacterium]